MQTLEISRRQFVGHLSSAALATTMIGSTFMLEGCDVWSEIEAYVPVAIDAVNGILSLLAMNGVFLAAPVQMIVNTIQAAFLALDAAVKEYKATTPPPATVLQKIETIFQDIIDNFSTFLQQLGLSGGLLAIISKIVQVILETITDLTGKIPTTPAQPGGSRNRYAVRIGAVIVPVIPRHRSKGAFKKDYNRILESGSKVGVNVPKAAYMKVSLLEHVGI